MKTIKILVTDDLWERFFRCYPARGERSRLLRNFVYKMIREETVRQLEREEER